jgi:predicted O-methyltransferase YrrM
MDRFHEAYCYLKHLLTAKKRHGVHSPFVYHLSDQVLSKSREFGIFEKLEALRRKLENDERVIEVQDYGAGSRVHNSSSRSVSQISKTALAPKKQSQALFKLTLELQPKRILELGTSLGLTTLYLHAAAGQNAQITTIEGAPAIAEIAKENFIHFGADTIQLRLGKFENQLSQLNQEFDLIYIDGDHRFGPTMNYFEKCKSLLSPKGWMILDDIYWSKEMTKAWAECVADERFNLALDFYHFGVLLRDNRKEREYYRLRL